MPRISRLARILLLAAILVTAAVWWLERDRARHVDRPDDDPAAQVAAARWALREIVAAQEIHAAEHEGRYATSIGALVGTHAELGRRLEPSRGVSAGLSADTLGGWYSAEVGHVDLGDWRCRVASDSAPLVLGGRLPPGEQVCDPTPDVDSAAARS